MLLLLLSAVLALGVLVLKIILGSSSKRKESLRKSAELVLVLSAARKYGANCLVHRVQALRWLPLHKRRGGSRLRLAVALFKSIKSQ